MSKSMRMTLAAVLVVVGAALGAAIEGLAQPSPPPAPAGSPPAAATPPPYQIEFLTRSDWTWDSWIAGNPLICMTDTGTGKIECFSFSTKDGNMAVYGPGCQDNSVNGQCSAFPMIDVSKLSSDDFVRTGKFPLSAADHATIVKIGTAWNAKASIPGRCDCSAFANQVARATHLKTPDISSTRTPKAYIQKLSSLNPSP